MSAATLHRGRILADDVATVRERTRIEEIVSDHVTLRPAGADALKGLCPFHDERTPSFQVRPSANLWHCFGCDAGGDVIAFVEKVDGLGFVDAVEFLASKAGITLRYEEAAGGRRPEEGPRRQRLVDAHAAAAAFYREHLLGAEALQARQFLHAKGFDRAAAARFGVGYAPKGWTGLVDHLRTAGFTIAELEAAGLVVQSERGVYDRFRGRVMWPIRDTTGQTIGFGARRLYDDDPGPKYLNTPETAIYKKAQVLYGIDLAKRDIARERQVVVVEGYTDVMAAHLAGVTTAVATCGTAFGSDHARAVRRLMGDHGTPGSTGAVVFTFDGDEAGQKAAVRAFAEDQRPSAQTFVAVAQDGLDPCDLRVRHGDDAVRNLVGSRQPLFEFVITRAIASHDLTTAEGRVAALRASAPVVTGIRDAALRAEYTRRLAGWVRLDLDTVQQAVANARSKATSPDTDHTPTKRCDGVTAAAGRTEAAALAIVLQRPDLAATHGLLDVPVDAFTVPSHRVIRDAITTAGDPSTATTPWVTQVVAHTPDDLTATVAHLAVAPMPEPREDALPAYVAGVHAALLDAWLTHQIADVTATLAELPPEDPRSDNALAQLLDLDDQRRTLTHG